MPILRSLPLLLTFRRPTLDLQGSSQKQEQHTPQQQEQGQVIDLSVATSQIPLGEYPVELFQVRVKSLQEHLNLHFPSTYTYVASVVSVLVFFIAFVITLLALHVSDGKLWVLGVIAVMILTFVSKMSFLARLEKAQKSIQELLQTFNNQDMVRYGVLYRLRPRHHTVGTRMTRMAYRFNLGLPCWTVDLTTIDHIDEHSFHDHPASDPHASDEEILARDNELPSYMPKTESDALNDPQHNILLGEALPPKYQETVAEDQFVGSSIHSASSSSSSPLTSLPSQQRP
ncbi:hypothetical protein EMPS_04540 [Entomortierella parvispora]|uniref:Uncharacterized protein n=1 Tax=Entomortierella parvispora TaxID=205924 RepID=A0A9P3H9D1_9FUNG|nr:hypothetical protein EMPS_04540 [Entomortierella parvispora]